MGALFWPLTPVAFIWPRARYFEGDDFIWFFKVRCTALLLLWLMIGWEIVHADTDPFVIRLSLSGAVKICIIVLGAVGSIALGPAVWAAWKKFTRPRAIDSEGSSDKEDDSFI